MAKIKAPGIRAGGPRIHFLILMTLWAVTIFGLMLWGIARINENTDRLADSLAKEHFNKDQALRLWATSHGGVYVPIDADTPPNPYLDKVSERDLVTPSGVKLTLMNPAYMLRQIHETHTELYGVKGHITSLRPIRPENAPDEWETTALTAFEAGTAEFRGTAEIEGKPYLRFMRPMVTAAECLKCHADGYKEGDIRGGVAISLPLDHVLENKRNEMTTLVLSHGSIFLVGMLALGVGMRRLERHDDELRLANEALIVSEKKYRKLFDDSTDGLFITTRQGELIDANEALLDLFGFEREEIFGMDIRSLYEDPAERAAFQEAVERDNCVKDHPIRVHKKDGTPMHCLLTAGVRFTNDGSVLGYQGIVRDITDKKLARETLERQAKELARSNSELQQFAYVASHDLQEPLRNIVSCVKLLTKRYEGKLGTDADKLLGFATDSATRMSTLIQDLLDYSRVELNHSALAPTDCEDVLKFVLENLSAAITDSRAAVTHDPLPTVTANSSQLGQVFQNLLSNAIKFRGEEAPKIHISAARRGAEWLISIRDSGIGMEKQYLDDIFVIFRRLHTQSEYRGTGIGLAIVKKIIERNGGRIWVESEFGKGSCFYFTLPVDGEQ
jgi:two-component system, chemotaxis family, sensor kinase Cph1